MPITSTHAADQVAVIGDVTPVAMAAGTDVSGWIDVADFHTIMAVCQTGALGTNATFNAKLQQATSASGTSAKDITGAAITQLTQAGTDQSNEQAVISIQSSALDVDGGFRFIQLSITVATATSGGSGLVLGCSPRVGPADANDSADVAEVVRVA